MPQIYDMGPTALGGSMLLRKFRNNLADYVLLQNNWPPNMNVR